MAMDFPASPTVGQQFTPPGSSTSWVWDGIAWNIVPEMSPAIISDTPPMNPAVGQFWFRGTNCQLYIWTDDGNSKQWVQVAGVGVATGLWEPVGTGEYILTAKTELIIPDLAKYKRMRFQGCFTNSAVAYLAMQLSLDNGATFKQGATDYGYQRVLAGGTGIAASTANLGSWAITTSNDPGANFKMTFNGFIEDFNQATYAAGLSQAGLFASSVAQIVTYFNRPSFVGPCNALRLFPTAGNFTGSFLLEGVRG